MQSWYNTKKSAQIAAFFATQEGGEIPLLKLVKLMYLAERRFMEQFDASMLRDHLVSMDHGPVQSITLNRMNGTEDDSAEWSAYIADRDSYNLSVTRDNLTDDELDELSKAELRVLHETWGEFGHLNKWQIRDYTHDYCPEWEDPHGSSSEIPYVRVFRYLGKPNAEELAQIVEDERHLALMAAE